MGFKVELPLYSLEEAQFLDDVLRLAAENAAACANAVRTRPEEVIKYNQKHEFAIRLRNRMNGEES